MSKANNAQAELVVTQADREAAAAFFHAWYKTSESSRSYDFTKACEDDRNPAVQAFARHRAAEIERMAGEVERYVLALAEIASMGYAGAPDIAMRRIAQRALGGGE